MAEGGSMRIRSLDSVLRGFRFGGSLALPAILLALAPMVVAHPVPRANHDRIVRVSFSNRGGDLFLNVDYRLEVDEATVVLDDMAPFRDEVDPVKFKDRRLDYYGEYMRLYAPLLAGKLTAKIDGGDLKFDCVKRTPALRDEKEQLLGHLRCDFLFEAKIVGNPTWGTLEFREATFLLQEGDVRLSLDSGGAWTFTKVIAPDEELWKRPATERRPGDEDRLREVRADFARRASEFELAPMPTRVDPAMPPNIEVAPAPTRVDPPPRHVERFSLLRLLQENEHGFVLMLAMAGLFGAFHALTPGHGKTLVAAYLVGQRGTVWHACVLGVVTTLTHTGAVLILAAVIHYFGLSPAMRAWMQASLPLILGLMIVCFGFFLLLQRLAGRADHVHVGGGHHHHHGERTDPVTWIGLIFLGVSGGIIPCWDAIIMLVWAAGMNLLHWALPMLLAVSAGLASVLVVLGIMVVKLRGFAGSRFGEGKWIGRLSILSALAVILLGFWLCREAIHPLDN